VVRPPAPSTRVWHYSVVRGVDRSGPLLAIFLPPHLPLPPLLRFEVGPSRLVDLFLLSRPQRHSTDSALRRALWVTSTRRSGPILKAMRMELVPTTQERHCRPWEESLEAYRAAVRLSALVVTASPRSGDRPSGKRAGFSLPCQGLSALLFGHPFLTARRFFRGDLLLAGHQGHAAALGEAVVASYGSPAYRKEAGYYAHEEKAHHVREDELAFQGASLAGG